MGDVEKLKIDGKMKKNVVKVSGENKFFLKLKMKKKKTEKRKEKRRQNWGYITNNK